METTLAQAEALVARMRAQMPLLAFMDIRAEHWDGRQLRLSAPLAPNRNDKDTAFAGAIASLSTVTGWALLTLWGESVLGPCQVAVSHADLRYRRPIRDRFVATATLPARQDLAQLRERIGSHGRGRIEVSLQVHCGDEAAVQQTATYAVWTVPY